MKRRLAVILMADMVDYSAAMEIDQADTIALIRELRERWLEPEAAQRGGEVLKRMGDGWIIAFDSVTDAVETAQTVQIALAGHRKIRLRIAAHLGEIVEDESDLYGAGINITARLQTEAPPGGVMISEDLLRQLDARLAEGFGDAGSFELKNISRPVAGYQWRPTLRAEVAVDDVPTIAIEPIAVSLGTTEAAHAAADLQEQIVHRLSRRTGIRVLSLDAPGVEADTQPTYLLRGRLRARGDTAKVALTFLLADSGAVAWSGAYEGAVDDLFGLSDAAAERADTELRLAINAHDGDRIAHLPEDALSASELRVRAARFFYETTVEGFEKACPLLERALRLAPDNAMSLAMWANAQVRVAISRYEELAPELAELAVARANQAVQNAPRSDYVVLVRGIVRLCVTRDIERARRDIERAVEINPSFTYAREWQGNLQLALGSYEEAARTFGDLCKDTESDPYRPYFAYGAAFALLLAKQPIDALPFVEEAVHERPNSRPVRLLQAQVAAQAGDAPLAALARAAAEDLPRTPDAFAMQLPLPEDGRSILEILAPERAMA